MKVYNCIYCNKENKYSHSSTNKYCNNICQGAATRNTKIRAWLYEGKTWTGNIPAWIKDNDGYLARKYGYLCTHCGISEYNGKRLVLECDHIDGNRANNQPDNLRFLCPNCHSQTDTFKGRNK